MPKEVEEFVKHRLDEDDFYPDLPEDERESIAWAIGYKQYNQKHHKKPKGRKKKASAMLLAQLASLCDELEDRHRVTESAALTGVMRRLAISD